MRVLWNRLAEYLVEPWVDPADELGQAYRTSDPGSSFKGRFFTAAIISAVVHAAVLVVLGRAIHEGRRYEPPPHLAVTDFLPEEPIELAEPELTAEVDDEPADSQLSAATESLVVTGADDSLLDNIPEPVDFAAATEIELPLPDVSGFEINDVVVQTGTVGVEVREVEGAVDRLTDEIMGHLEENRILIVWLMDASISLAADRQEVAQRLERIYHEIDALGGTRDDALKSAVVAYGLEMQEMAPPTTDAAEIVEAIRKVPTDKSGMENVFSAVLGCVVQYQRERHTEHRRMLLAIWTDESGNDVDRLENAVQFCRNNAIPVYVVGPSSMFGKQQGTMSYKHTDGKTYQLPVDRGPDTVREERLHLPYWFDGNQYESMVSGLGPFALTRLAHETGGAYFIKDHAADRTPFDMDVMRHYLPDYESPEIYLRQAAASPLRRAVLAAVEITHQRKVKGTPRLSFAPNGKTYFNEMREAQETAAYDAAVLQQALAPFGARGLEQAYAKEHSRRWRAWYDLTYGRLLAMTVRCYEYNWACAVMKGKGADFVDKQSNRWQFKPDATLHFGSQSQRAAKEATRLLTRCVKENAGTPWALLAQRELKDPFGFRVEEAYVAPPPPPPKAKPGKPTPPPPPPPANQRRMEQPRKLAKPVEKELPKL